MKALLAPSHSELENALRADIQRNKSADPFSAVLILVPSDTLRRRLKIFFALENGMNFLNVYLMTFHQLYARLGAEIQTYGPPAANDFILSEALGYWIRSNPNVDVSFKAVAQNAGGCGALWQTLRDLKDAGVDPANLTSALDENLWDKRDRKNLGKLAQLYDGFLTACRTWGFSDYSDYVSSVKPSIASSVFLKRFQQIFYYGFYDLTQIQLDVLYELARHYPTNVLFPMARGHPGWLFAQRFYERYLQGFVTEQVYLSRPGEDRCVLPLFADQSAPAVGLEARWPRLAIISCAGPRDELITVAKEILRLTEEEGIPFSEIGVVARSLEPYSDWLKETFRDHRIPIHSSAEEPLLQRPFAKAASLLLELRRKDYFRSHFVDLVSSPFFVYCTSEQQQSRSRSDLWDVLTRRLGITKGIEEWSRLKRYLDRGLEVTGGNEHESVKVQVAPEQVSILWNLFTEVHHDLSTVPAEASWSEYVRCWRVLFQKYLTLPDTRKVTAELEQDQAIVSETLSTLCMLDRVQPCITVLEFLEAAQRLLERKFVPMAQEDIHGVVVLDALAARGSRFTALFIIGLNEGIFPRVIREDPFLRDGARRVLETVLGYKIGEKLSAYDEEKLLFSLLISAAAERLYCLYQRSDDSGRTLECSWYVDELERAFDTTGIEIVKSALPRGIREKKDVDPYRSDFFLLPEELAIRLTLDGMDPGFLLCHFPAIQDLYNPGRKLLASIENVELDLSAYDGITGHLPEHWRELQKRGAAPTALERYARCPFQFYAANILDLHRLKRPEQEYAIEPAEIGKLVHDILRSSFGYLLNSGFFTAPNPALDVPALVEAVAKNIFSEYENENPVGYRVIWELIQEEILVLLKRYVQQELQTLYGSGHRPLALEIELAGKFPDDWPKAAAALPIYGKADRIDLNAATAEYRVIDYKFTLRRKPASGDGNLQLAVIRGERLQPPLYLLLARDFAERQAVKPGAIEVVFHYLAPRCTESPFLQSAFSADHLQGAYGAVLGETVSVLIRGIRDGHYFIYPGDACRTCDVTQVCRKNHLPTLWRTAQHPLTRLHASIATRDLPQT